MTPGVSDIDWETWTGDQVATLLYVIRDGEVLLIHKKRGIGEGKINAPGGRVDPGETPIEAAERETHEELGIRPRGTRQVGEVLFHVLDGTSIHIHVFRADDLEGEPRETDEARPQWFPLDALPYDRMWEDDRHWFAHLLNERRFVARTVFRGDELLGYEVLVQGGSGPLACD